MTGAVFLDILNNNSNIDLQGIFCIGLESKPVAICCYFPHASMRCVGSKLHDLFAQDLTKVGPVSISLSDFTIHICGNM